ncbi:MAG TPA: FAD-dependent oxidoreductase [Candidatus Limnocylindrales bacterium]|nr:FAD-dependent oxidoreductase [Candidatus Limnocylindrales bacterium]
MIDPRPDPIPEPVSFWLRDPAPDGVADPPLARDQRVEVDVAIIGGGFTGLWTAIALTDTDPSLRVVVLEMETIAFGASGRNGGFCEASLTHGLANGIKHFPDELERLEREGIDNLRSLIAFTREHGIDCDLEETGVLALADQHYQVDEFRAWVDEAAEHGERLEFLDRDAAREEVHSPLWHAGLYRPPGRNILVDPAKLCRGIARVARERGVRIHEGTRVTRLERRAGRVEVRAAGAGMVVADQVVVATSAYSGWLPRLASTFVPVYDYALVSEPLTPEQRDAIGWRRRQGLADANNQFHYFRLTADDRILWGGYDAIHHRGSRVGPELDRRPQTFDKLEAQFFRAFPQLAGLGFPYRWGGAIDTTSRFTVTFGQILGGRVTYALGYTGLGVGASRWAAGVVRDFILRPDEDRLRLRLVTSPPVPFPPEPLRSFAVDTVRHELDRADRNEGRRGLILRTLDAAGIGFDS